MLASVRKATLPFAAKAPPSAAPRRPDPRGHRCAAASCPGAAQRPRPCGVATGCGLICSVKSLCNPFFWDVLELFFSSKSVAHHFPSGNVSLRVNSPDVPHFWGAELAHHFAAAHLGCAAGSSHLSACCCRAEFGSGEARNSAYATAWREARREKHRYRDRECGQLGVFFSIMSILEQSETLFCSSFQMSTISRWNRPI